MKTTLKLTLVAAAAFLFMGTGVAGAQQKFGYINTQELVTSMPETDSMQVSLQELNRELSLQFETMRNEFANKTQDYAQTVNTASETIRKQKEKDLYDMQTRLDEFQQSANEEITAKQQELIQPILKKAQDAVNKVSKAQGMVVVFDVSSGAIPYYSEDLMVNILPMVRRELGITK